MVNSEKHLVKKIIRQFYGGKVKSEGKKGAFHQAGKLFSFSWRKKNNKKENESGRKMKRNKMDYISRKYYDKLIKLHPRFFFYRINIKKQVCVFKKKLFFFEFKIKEQK